MDYEEKFRGLNDATADDRLPKYTNGDFRLAITSVETQDHEEYGLSVFIDCVVLSSTNPKYPAGSKVSAKIGNLSAVKKSSKDTALRNLKSFLAAVLSIDADSAQNWVGLLQMCETHNLFAGATFIDNDVETKKSKAGHDFILHNFSTDAENPRPIAVMLQDMQARNAA